MTILEGLNRRSEQVRLLPPEQDKQRTYMNIEKKVEHTITEQPAKITVAGRDFAIPSPSIATLVMLSAAIAELPEMSFKYKNGGDSNEIVSDVLRNAKDCGSLGEIVAIAMLGAKGVEVERVQCEEKRQRKGLLGKIGICEKVTVWKEIDKKNELADWLMKNATPSELVNVLFRLIGMMEVGDFFALITSLREVTVTKRTKGTTTASGQSSPAQ